MRRLHRPLALVPFLALVLAATAARGAFAADGAAALGGTRGAVVRAIDDARDKILDLAKAMPEGKYSWRPGKGVRSVGEVYQHVAQGNFSLPTMLGVKAPDDVTLKGLDTAKMTRDQVITLLQRSFGHAEEAIAATPEAALGDSVKIFGRMGTKLDVMMIMATHVHEHLGQSIAYARTNGVVPPWTARAEEAHAAAGKKEMEAGAKDKDAGK